MNVKNRLFNTLLFLLAYLITCAAVASGSYFRAGLALNVGEISDRKIKATNFVENKIATERNRIEAEARAEDMKPILTKDNAVESRVSDNIAALFSKIDAIRLSYAWEVEERLQAAQAAEAEALRQTEEALAQAEQNVEGAVADTVEEPAVSDPVTNPVTDAAVADEGIESPIVNGEAPNEAQAEPPANPEDLPLTEEEFKAFDMFSGLPVIFTESQQQYLVTVDGDGYLQLSDIAYNVAHTVMDQGVQELDSKTIMAVQDELRKSALTEDAVNIAYEIVSTHLIPNVVVDEEATRLERENIAATYDTVWLMKDQTIVDDGERITEEAYAIMESLGMLNTGIEDKLLPMVGAFILIAAVFAACLMYIIFFRKKVAAHKKETVLLFMLYLIVLAVTWTLGGEKYVFLPLLVFPMLVSVLIDLRASLVLSLGMTVVCYFIVSGSVDFFLFYLISGTLFGLLAKYTVERNKVFMVGLVAAFVNFLLYCAIALVMEKNNALNMWPLILTHGGYAALNGALVVIVCMGSLPIWEAVFGVVTPIKLLDLTNPTNLLLRRLTIEAPGTYHHSLIVANLAETAAYDIGANPNKARVGGYYHDIGKLKYPQYFAENLAGENPHDHLDPFNSVQLIISHVAYGLTLAAEYRLPQFVRDIIQEHHGRTLIQFFYCKAKDESPDQPIDEKDFRYPYVIPQSRESACVMLADTVEAAVRSMITRFKSIDEVEKQITTLIRGKLNDNQLADSGLSIKDVDTISQSFFRVLKGMYHERIAYPKMKTEERE